jgi:deoxyxylulose-5-phosphate synthase
MSNILNHILSPKDLRQLKQADLPQLAKELREFIIHIVATKEGHLGASLGVVELTIALHYVFNTPDDLLIWDVGHQAYGHKILTGRQSIFHTNRQLNGISGFPKRSESVYDTFGVGHSSTSISAALGMAIASQLKGEDKHHIAVIGDASIASGMAFEGLNHAGVTDANLLIILNDNAIGIDPSVGALKHYLTNVKKGVENQDNIFEALNFNYSGPIDGHDLKGLILELERLKSVKGPKLLHVITTKGKGLRQAEENQVTYHAPGKFDALTGDLIKKITENEPPKFQDVFDLVYLRCIPNLIIFAPRNEIELRNIMFTAQNGLQQPIAIRYPRGKGNIINWIQPFEAIEIGKGIQLKKGSKIAVLSIGTMANNVSKAIEKCNMPEVVSHYDMRFVKPLDVELLQKIFTTYKYVITVEDGVKHGGFGSAVLEYASKQNYQEPIKLIGIDDMFVEHGTLQELQHLTGLDVETICNCINENLLFVSNS